MKTVRQSYFLVVAAYISWGILPIYWSLLSSTPSTTVLLFRAVCSAAILYIFTLVRGDTVSNFIHSINRKTILNLISSTVLLLINWLSYLWAIEHGDYISASLAYFICPVLTVACGSLFLKEKFSRRKKLAFALIFIGLALRTLVEAQLPLLALVIGGSFCGYTLARKTSSVSADHALIFELTAMSLLVALLTFSQQPDIVDDLLSTSHFELLLLVASGAATLLPMIWFIKGAKHLPLQVVGILQYLAPSVMLLCAVTYNNETVTEADLLSFPLIWFGILLFVSDMFSPKIAFRMRLMRQRRSAARRARFANKEIDDAVQTT